jgi:hypothetical protein
MGWLSLFLPNFLQGNYFCVHLGNAISVHYLHENVVPQGSVLNMILFAVTIDKMINVYAQYVSTSLYVDIAIVMVPGALAQLNTSF